MKVFSNMKRSTKGFSGQEVPLFSTMLDAAESSHSPSRSTSSPSPTPTSSPTPESTHTQPSPQPSPPQPSPTQPSPTHLGSEYHPPTPHDSPLHAVHSHGSDEEADLTKTKQTYSSAYTKLILRVKNQETQNKGSFLMKVVKKEEFMEKASTETELFYTSNLTPTEVMPCSKRAVGKQVNEISTAVKKKD
ncbi:hypothetical protein Tco_1301889 [Tanacetum coccineum]